MSGQQDGKKKPYLQAVVLGIISIASYVFVFADQDLVTELTTRGGAYSALAIFAALYFSVVHGAFASNVLSVLGVEAAKKKGSMRPNQKAEGAEESG